MRITPRRFSPLQPRRTGNFTMELLVASVGNGHQQIAFVGARRAAGLPHLKKSARC